MTTSIPDGRVAVLGHPPSASQVGRWQKEGGSGGQRAMVMLLQYEQRGVLLPVSRSVALATWPALWISTTNRSVFFTGEFCSTGSSVFSDSGHAAVGVTGLVLQGFPTKTSRVVFPALRREAGGCWRLLFQSCPCAMAPAVTSCSPRLLASPQLLAAGCMMAHSPRATFGVHNLQLSHVWIPLAYVLCGSR